MLYNSSLLEITDTIVSAKALGFVVDVVLLSTAPDAHQLRSQMQTLSFRQQRWKRRHGAFFDTKKTFWVLFSQHDIDTTSPPTINFADRKRIPPAAAAKWLGVLVDRALTFKQHKLNVVAKGRQRAGLLANLSTTGWGIPPKLLKILMTTTIHAATDYGVMAWLPTDPPNFFVEQMTAVDLTCARAALGSLKTTPAVFLRHDPNLTPVTTRLQSKILRFMALSLTKPQSHPLFQIIQRAQLAPAKTHKDPFDAFFQHPLRDQFDKYITQLPVDPAAMLIRPPNRP